MLPTSKAHFNTAGGKESTRYEWVENDDHTLVNISITTMLPNKSISVRVVYLECNVATLHELIKAR